jgi:hypothetical protein
VADINSECLADLLRNTQSPFRVADSTQIWESFRGSDQARPMVLSMVPFP